MRGGRVDPRVRCPTCVPRVVRWPGCWSAACADGLLTVAQAFAVGSLVVVGRGRPGGRAGGAGRWGSPSVALRALASYAVERVGSTAAGGLAATARRLLDAATRTDAGDGWPGTHRRARPARRPGARPRSSRT